jgi:hypothetical protein
MIAIKIVLLITEPKSSGSVGERKWTCDESLLKAEVSRAKKPMQTALCTSVNYTHHLGLNVYYYFHLTPSQRSYTGGHVGHYCLSRKPPVGGKLLVYNVGERSLCLVLLYPVIGASHYDLIPSYSHTITGLTWVFQSNPVKIWLKSGQFQSNSGQFRFDIPVSSVWIFLSNPVKSCQNPAKIRSIPVGCSNQIRFDIPVSSGWIFLSNPVKFCQDPVKIRSIPVKIRSNLVYSCN